MVAATLTVAVVMLACCATESCTSDMCHPNNRMRQREPSETLAHLVKNGDAAAATAGSS